MSLVQYYKHSPNLTTDIGQFEFKGDLGQGGNANVLKFERSGHAFAIKFIQHGEDSKLRRFRDEYFCAAQIPTHKNVVHAYHFDTKEIEGITYSLIVMKFYAASLHKQGPIAEEKIEDQAVKVRRLFEGLLSGLEHLHTHDIVHRDIKPHNIFYDADADTHVVGDLGIAHFNSEIFAKEALTRPTDRLANYLFSAPEQADSKNSITAAADIYSLGQVMQWYLTGKTVRGQGRPRFSSGAPTEFLSILDDVVDKAIQNEPLDRFQSIGEIRSFMAERRKPKPDPWIQIHAFDDAIRSSFPRIGKTIQTSNHDEITRFLTNFQKKCLKKEFWYVLPDGGDNVFVGLEHLAERRWLLNGDTEITVSSLLIYRDNGYPYKNFFILLFGPDKKFEFKSIDGEPVQRTVGEEWESDMGTLFDNKHYVHPDETKNGYFELAGEILPFDRKRFKDRYRHLVPSAVMVVPQQTASAVMTNRSPTTDLIASAISHKDLHDPELTQYLNATRNYHSSEITKFN